MRAMGIVPAAAILLVAGTVSAAPEVLWQSEAETVVPKRNMRYGAGYVDDPAASGGKAVRIPYKKGTSRWVVQFGAGKMKLQGRCIFTFSLRGEDMLPLSDGMQITLIAHDKDTGHWAEHEVWVVFGVNLNPEGYTTISLPLDMPLTADTYGTSVLFEWRVKTEGISPVLYFDKAEIRSQRLDAPVIAEVWPTKVRYEPGENVGVRVTLFNPTAKDAQVTLIGEEHFGLASTRKAFTRDVTLDAGERKDVSAKWKLGKEEYGREIAVTLTSGGKALHSASELFGVCKTPLWLSTGNDYDGAKQRVDRHTIFYQQPATGHETMRAIRFLRKHSPGQEYLEYYNWSPGDISDLAPDEDPFPGGSFRLKYRSRETIRMQVRMHRAAGMWPVSYINGSCWGLPGYRLFARRPEWFLYDANGEVQHYAMDRREIYRDKDDADFDPNTYPEIFFQAILNHSLPEVQKYIARQFVRCGREIGFKGVRMDVRYLEVHPGEYDFGGKEIAPTHKQADRISAASVKNVKRLVHRELPDFTFGYNYSSPGDNRNMPLTMQERCRGGAWMLDEVCKTYFSKTSPYHVWKAYLRRMVSWGDQVNRWSGIYNPFDCTWRERCGPADKIYSSLFRLIAFGRFVNWYCNSSLPFGNLGRVSTRYGELFYGKNRRWIPEVKDEVSVKSSAPIWWRDTVFWNRDTAGRRQLIVFLINPPAAAKVEENPQSKLNPPVRNIEVTAAKVDGRLPTAAYLVMGEPMEPTGRNAVRSVKLPLKRASGARASVTVPSVIFWKAVVYEY